MRRILPLALLPAAAVVLSLRDIYSPDIGFHLNAARWMTQHLAFPDADTFTYTGEGERYVDLNWLYQLLMYGLYLAGGSAAMLTANALAVAVAFLTVQGRLSASAGRFTHWVVLAGLLALAPSLEVRPHSFSWLLLSLTLYVLQRHHDGDDRIIRWLPVILLVWVNTHSLFVLGLAAAACYAVSALVRRRARFRRVTAYAALAAACCLVNPWGMEGFLLPFRQVAALQAGNIFHDNIIELQSPFSITTYALTSLHRDWHFFDVFAALAAWMAARRARRLETHEWLILLLFAGFAFSAAKNIGYFVFAVLPFLAAGDRPRGSRAPAPGRLNLTLHLAAVTVLVASVITDAFYIHYRAGYRFGLGWSSMHLPLDAAGFIGKNGIDERILNNMEAGGWLAFTTGRPVAADGRLDVMGERRFARHVAQNSDTVRQRLMEQCRPGVVIFSYASDPGWITFMQLQGAWRLAHADGLSAVYLRDDVAPHLPALTSGAVTEGAVLRSAAETDALVRQGRKAFPFSFFFTRQYYPEREFNRMAFCLHYGWMDDARTELTEGFERSTADYPELYLNFGTLYFAEQNAAMALLCYERYLDRRKHSGVEERVRFLRSLR